jgi:hypothetical protein
MEVNVTIVLGMLIVSVAIALFFHSLPIGVLAYIQPN